MLYTPIDYRLLGEQDKYHSLRNFFYDFLESLLLIFLINSILVAARGEYFQFFFSHLPTYTVYIVHQFLIRMQLSYCVCDMALTCDVLIQLSGFLLSVKLVQSGHTLEV